MTATKIPDDYPETFTDDNGVEMKQRWECEPPGPQGSGVNYQITDAHYWRDADGQWFRIVYAWEPA